MRRCIKCYAELDGDELICKRCGSDKYFVEKESEVTCPRCGATNEGRNSECYSCGHSLKV